MSVESAVSLAIKALIRPFEGYHRRLPDGGCAAYPDPGTKAAPWTIGYGATGPEIGPETRWTHEQALAALHAHALHFALGVLALSPALIREPDRRFSALISFAYNCGVRNYRISTLRRRVNHGDWSEAAREILKWDKAAGRVLPGLTRRRRAEADMLA